MKKLIIVLTMTLTSCGMSQMPVMLEDGEVIYIDKPGNTYKIGDTIVVKQVLNGLSNRHHYYGKYVGKLPYNPEPCSSYKMRDSSLASICFFYQTGIIIE